MAVNGNFSALMFSASGQIICALLAGRLGKIPTGQVAWCTPPAALTDPLRGLDPTGFTCQSSRCCFAETVMRLHCHLLAQVRGSSANGNFVPGKWALL